jgi:hypothetical protein
VLLLKEDFLKFGKVFAGMPDSFTNRLFLDASKSTNTRCYLYIRNFLLSNGIVMKTGTIYHKKFPTIEAFFKFLIQQNKQREFFSQYIDMKVVNLIFKSTQTITNKRELYSLYPHRPASVLFSELRRLQSLNIITMDEDGSNITPNFPSFDEWMLDFAKRCS